MQGRLDFAELDAVTAALDLGIVAAEEIEQTIGSTARPVARTVDTIVRARAPGAGKESVAGLLRVVPVSRAQTDTADVQIADFAVRQLTPLTIEDHQLLAVAGGADGNRLPPRRPGARHPWHNPVCCLC